jgi:spermidine/putrescine transport system permease protein
VQNPLLLLFTIGVLIFMYAPITAVFVNAFNADETLVRWGGFTLEWFENVFENTRVRAALRTSLTIAAITTAISLVIAVAAGLWGRKASRRLRLLLDTTTFMRIILPEVVMALALFVMFVRLLDLELGMWTIIIGHVVFNSAVATIVIQARLATMSTTLEDAAADLGAPPRRVFLRATLPQLWPAVVVAALLSFTFSFDDVITSFFLAGSGAETLPMLVFGLARFRISPEINAIGASVMVATLTLLAIALLFARLRSSGGLALFGARKVEADRDESV